MQSKIFTPCLNERIISIKEQLFLILEKSILSLYYIYMKSTYTIKEDEYLRKTVQTPFPSGLETVKPCSLRMNS